jgi:hypothetical protein
MLVRTTHNQIKHLPKADWSETAGKGGIPVLEAEISREALEKHGLVLYVTHDGWRVCKLHQWQGYTYVATGKAPGRVLVVILRKED